MPEILILYLAYQTDRHTDTNTNTNTDTHRQMQIWRLLLHFALLAHLAYMPKFTNFIFGTPPDMHMHRYTDICMHIDTHMYRDIDTQIQIHTDTCMLVHIHTQMCMWKI